MRSYRLLPACALFFLNSPRLALAQDAARCATAYEDTQVLRRNGRLLEARASAIACSAASCPAVLARDCSRWVAEIEPAIPRVVLSIKDQTGAAIEGVTIYFDGKVFENASGGQSIEVDPGEHVLRFERDGQTPVERRTLFIEGEKNHRVSVMFSEPSPATSGTPAPRRPPPVAAWVAVGISGAALAASTIFGARALKQRADLDRSGCKPRCDPDEVLALQRSAVFADVSGATAIVAAVGALYLFLNQPRAPVSASKSGLGTSIGAATDSPTAGLSWSRMF